MDQAKQESVTIEVQVETLRREDQMMAKKMMKRWKLKVYQKMKKAKQIIKNTDTKTSNSLGRDEKKGGKSKASETMRVMRMRMKVKQRDLHRKKFELETLACDLWL